MSQVKVYWKDQVGGHRSYWWFRRGEMGRHWILDKGHIRLEAGRRVGVRPGRHWLFMRMEILMKGLFDIINGMVLDSLLVRTRVWVI